MKDSSQFIQASDFETELLWISILTCLHSGNRNKGSTKSLR